MLTLEAIHHKEAGEREVDNWGTFCEIAGVEKNVYQRALGKHAEDPLFLVISIFSI